LVGSFSRKDLFVCKSWKKVIRDLSINFSPSEHLFSPLFPVPFVLSSFAFALLGLGIVLSVIEMVKKKEIN